MRILDQQTAFEKIENAAKQETKDKSVQTAKEQEFLSPNFSKSNRALTPKKNDIAVKESAKPLKSASSKKEQ